MAPLIYDCEISSHDDLQENTNTTEPAVSSRSKGVSFGAMDVTHDVIGLGDYTPEEIDKGWYSDAEIQRMKDETRSDAKMVEYGLLIADTPNASPRGLESRTKKGTLRKTGAKLDAYAAVFSEIELQKEENFVDHELIADAYFIHSEPCALAARRIGEKDAIEARKIYRRKTESLDRTSHQRTTFGEKIRRTKSFSIMQ